MKGRAALSAAAICVALGSVARADGPGAYRPSPSRPPPAEQAREAYDAGVKLIEKGGYEQALSQFEKALRIEPQMYEALTYVGYANRKLGRYEIALKAYEKALHLKPQFAPAIEYQGEAFLGLNRIEDAKHNYFRLYATAPEQADKLLVAMGKWVEMRRRNPEGVDAAAVDGLAIWVAERTALKTERSGSEPAATGW